MDDVKVVEGHTATTTTESAPESNEQVPSDTKDSDEFDGSSFTISNFLLVGAVLTFFFAIFLWLGGLRFAKRVLSGKRRGKYSKVGSDDLEK